jgi:hypothetical protein
MDSEESCSGEDRSRADKDEEGAENRLEGGMYGRLGVKMKPCVRGVKSLCKFRSGSVLGSGGRGFKDIEYDGRQGTEAE